jgi:hypothetical protein
VISPPRSRRDAEQHCQPARHLEQQGGINVPNDPADLGSLHGLRPGNHDLRPLLQSTEVDQFFTLSRDELAAVATRRGPPTASKGGNVSLHGDLP